MEKYSFPTNLCLKKGLIVKMSNPSNMDMGKLMSMLSKMDKGQLEQGLSKLNQILSSEDKEKIMKELQKGNK